MSHDIIQMQIQEKTKYLKQLQEEYRAKSRQLEGTFDDGIRVSIKKSLQYKGQDIKDTENEIAKLESQLKQSTIPKEEFIYGELFNFLPFGTSRIIEQIREKSKNFIKNYISDFCRDYIQHSLKHPDRAIGILNNWLLDEEQKKGLQENKWTIFFLYASVYLYDIGLSSPPLLQDIQSLPNSRSQIHKLRATRAELIIKNYWEELGIEDETQAQKIARICGCQELNLDNPEVHLSMSYGTTGKNIDVPFIVSCLKILYHIDLTQKRIPFLFEKFLPNALTVLDNHFNFLGVVSKDDSKEFENEIRASLDCDDIETHRAFKQHEGLVQTILNEANRNITRRFKYTEVNYEIANHNYDPIDFKFKVETSAALEIFMGTPIYTEKATFLRELIQNAIDACELRSISEPSYQPKISVETKPGFKTIIIKDNGIGMDRNRVEKYFLPIGISFYRSQEFENRKFENKLSLDVGFSPISRFGIGILSCFMVAEKIILRTKKQGSVGLEMEIYDFKNYFIVRLDNSIEQGTEIVVTLKPDYTDIDCLSFLQNHIKCTKYPIEYIYFDGERKEIAQEPISLVSQLKQKYWSEEWKSYIEQPVPLSSPNSEGYIAFHISYPTADSSTYETYTDEAYSDNYINEAYLGVSQFFMSAILKGSETFVFWFLLGIIVEEWLASLAYFDENYYLDESYPDESYPDESYPDESYPDESYPDEAYPDESYPDEAYPDESYPDENYEAYQIQPDFRSGYMSACEVNVFQDGIYICDEPNLLPEWITRNIICRINLLDEDRLDLAISRSGLIKNLKYTSLQQILNGSLVLLFNEVFDQLKSQYQKRVDYQAFLKKIIEENFKIVNDAALIKLLRDFYCFTLLTDDQQILGYYFYDELSQVEKKIVIFIDDKRFTKKNIQLYEPENPCFIVGKDAQIINLIDKMGKYERVEQRLRRINLLEKRDIYSNSHNSEVHDRSL